MIKTLSDIKTMLTGISGFADKVAYRAFPENKAPPLPFICFREDMSDNFAADGIVYYPVLRVNIELYSRLKDLASEQAIENALTQAGIFYEKSESYIEAEQVFMELYEFEV